MNAMGKRILVAALIASAALAAKPLATNATKADSARPEQTSKEGNIVVKVRPITLAGEIWEFSLTFETHTGALTGDPAEFSVLVDDAGRALPALGWEGDPPGSHHRKGVLRFRAAGARGGKVELRVRDVGGVAERVFRWHVP